MFCRRFELNEFFFSIFLVLILSSSVLPRPYFLQTEKLPLKQFDETLFESKEDQIKKNLDFSMTNTAAACLPEKKIYFSLCSAGGLKVPVTFFDRNSNKLLVLGQGFGNEKEIGIPLAEKFKNYDVVLFDFRWKNMKKFIRKFSTIWAPTKKLVFAEKEEIFTVVDYFKNQKKYEQVIGLGECYGAFTFIVAQVEAQKTGKSLFDKLILDSCWISLESFMRQILLDPWLVTNPRKGGASKAFKRFYKGTGIYFLAYTLFSQITPQVSIKKYLSQLKNTPILFIHSINDKLVPLHSDFDKIWTSASRVSKAAVLTPFAHVENSTKVPFYQKLCEDFIVSKDVDSFITKFVA